jgi:hypothetical protein
MFGILKESSVGNPMGEEWLVRDGNPVNGLRRQDVMAIQKEMRLATIHETMGPNWKRVFWINDRPMVRK